MNKWEAARIFWILYGFIAGVFILSGRQDLSALSLAFASWISVGALIDEKLEEVEP